MTDETVHDSPVGWVNRHIQRYVESDGERGHKWGPGVPTLLLTTTGRRTGLKRRTALIYGRDGDACVVVGSVGGSSKHPNWYLNLSAQPQVDVQVGADRFAAVARTATGDKRARLWELMCGIYPTYKGFQKKTKRERPSSSSRQRELDQPNSPTPDRSGSDTPACRIPEGSDETGLPRQLSLRSKEMLAQGS